MPKAIPEKFFLYIKHDLAPLKIFWGFSFIGNTKFALHLLLFFWSVGSKPSKSHPAPKSKSSQLPLLCNGLSKFLPKVFKNCILWFLDYLTTQFHTWVLNSQTMYLLLYDLYRACQWEGSVSRKWIMTPDVHADHFIHKLKEIFVIAGRASPPIWSKIFSSGASKSYNRKARTFPTLPW